VANVVSGENVFEEEEGGRGREEDGAVVAACVSGLGFWDLSTDSLVDFVPGRAAVLRVAFLCAACCWQDATCLYSDEPSAAQHRRCAAFITDGGAGIARFSWFWNEAVKPS